jgi:hypothetical protein
LDSSQITNYSIRQNPATAHFRITVSTSQVSTPSAFGGPLPIASLEPAALQSINMCHRLQWMLRTMICFLWISLPQLVNSLTTNVSPQHGTRPSVGVLPMYNAATEVEGSFSALLLKEHWGREPILIRGAFSSDDVAWPSRVTMLKYCTV